MALKIQLLLITILLFNYTRSSSLRYKRESEQKDDRVSEFKSKDDKRSELLEEMFSDDEEIRVLEDLLTELEENLYSDYHIDNKDAKPSEGVGVTNPPKININSEEIHKNEEEVGDSTEEIPTATEYFEKDLADDIFDGIEEDLVEIVKDNTDSNSTMILGIAIGSSVSLSCGVAILVLYLVYLRKVQYSGTQPVSTTES